MSEISRNKVVTLFYAMKNEDGEVLQEMNDDTPFSYLHGHDNIIPGLEDAVAGQSAGYEVTVTIPPEKAYGYYDEALKTRVPLKRLKGYGKLTPGQQLNLNTEHGVRQVFVLKVGRYTVDIDGNHPLCGQTLTFDLSVKDVRDATDDEIAHGHAHGLGGHHH